MVGEHYMEASCLSGAVIEWTYGVGNFYWQTMLGLGRVEAKLFMKFSRMNGCRMFESSA